MGDTLDFLNTFGDEPIDYDSMAADFYGDDDDDDENEYMENVEEYLNNWFYSPKQATEIVGVSGERLKQMMRKGQIRAVKSPLGILYYRPDIKDQAAKRNKPVPED